MKCNVQIINSQRFRTLTREQKRLICRTVQSVAEYEGVQCDCEVCVNLVGKVTIRRLNREFRGIDRTTDVLSFPSGEYPPQGQDHCYLGDIAINVAQAQFQAEEYGHSFEREIAFLTAHSALHLLGYDHQTESEARDMFARQEAVLTAMGVTR